MSYTYHRYAAQVLDPSLESNFRPDDIYLGGKLVP